MNNNNNNQNDEYNNKLYNSVFNNIITRRVIFNHLNIFNILYNNISFKSIEEWDQFKYKDYLNKVTFHFDMLLLGVQLPENIKQIEIPSTSQRNTSLLNSTMIMEKVEHINSIKLLKKTSLDELESPFIGSIISTSKLNILKLSIENLNQLKPNSIPASITDLELKIHTSSGELSNTILPRGLKKLRINNIESFQDGCLPESLTDVHLTNSNPKLINQLPSNGALVKLYYSNKKTIYKDVKLPNSIQELLLYCESFYFQLPDKLRSLTLTTASYQQKITFPSTLEHLQFYNKYNQRKEIYINEILPPNLKSLILICSTIMDTSCVSILPNQLERLYIQGTFNLKIQTNQFPSSLTYLDLGNSFDQIIDVGVLPSTLNTLVFGTFYMQVINPSAIPSNLKSLIILNQVYYRHPIKLTPSTHPYTLIECYNLKLYYQPSITDIRVLALPHKFNSSLSTLQLQDKEKLEYLKLGQYFNQPIQLSDLPINNQIKTLELDNSFKQIINLEYFQNLETIILNNKAQPKIITTTTIDNNNFTTYNNYKLQHIIVSSQVQTDFIKKLDSNFYQFIKLKQQLPQQQPL